MINYYYDKKNYRSSSIVHRAVSSFKTDYTQKTHSHTTGTHFLPFFFINSIRDPAQTLPYPPYYFECYLLLYGWNPW